MAIRRDILAAASQVFSSKGYERAVLDDVAKIVGIQKGSLYHHIASKEQLLFEIHEQLSDDLWNATEEALRLSDSPTEQLREVIHVVMKLVATRHEDVGVFVREHRALTGNNLAIALKRRRQYLVLIEDIIQRGIDAGEFKPLAPRIAALGVLGMTNWSHEWFDPQGVFDADYVASTYSSMVLDGISLTTTEQ